MRFRTLIVFLMGAMVSMKHLSVLYLYTRAKVIGYYLELSTLFVNTIVVGDAGRGRV